MKNFFVFLTVFFFSCPFVWAEEAGNAATANAVYAPTSTVYSGSFAPAMPTPYISGPLYAPSGGEAEVLKFEWEDLPLEVLEPNFGIWETICSLFSSPYQAAVFYRLPENSRPVKIHHQPAAVKSLKLLGQIQVKDMAEKAPLEVIRRAIWWAKEETGTSNVVVFGKGVRIARSNSSGIGVSSVSAMITSTDYKDAITTGGSGLFASSSGWLETGWEITVNCYGDPVYSESFGVQPSAVEKRSDSSGDDPIERLRRQLN